MRSIVKATREPALEMLEVPGPEVGPNDVLVRTHKTTICGTDLHIFNWVASSAR